MQYARQNVSELSAMDATADALRHAKYDALIARCDRPAARSHGRGASVRRFLAPGRDRSGRGGHHPADPGGPRGEDPPRRRRRRHRHFRPRHRRCAAQPRRGRARRRDGARRRGGGADEGQPAHRRAHGRGRAATTPASAPSGASATSSSWTCRPIRSRCSSPMRRSTSPRRWRTRWTSSQNAIDLAQRARRRAAEGRDPVARSRR